LIEIIARNGLPEAMLCPAFMCDSCRKQVVGPGNVVSKVRHTGGHQRETSPLFVAHKGVCKQSLAAELDRAYPLDSGWSMIWDELETFVRQLAHNLTSAFADDPDGEYLTHRVVWATQR
jgi:hypothetical protein